MLNLIVVAVMALTGTSWVGVSITTSKTEEAMYQRYFRTEADCRAAYMAGDAEDRVCIPIPQQTEEWLVQYDKERRAEFLAACYAEADTYWLDEAKKNGRKSCEDALKIPGF